MHGGLRGFAAYTLANCRQARSIAAGQRGADSLTLNTCRIEFQVQSLPRTRAPLPPEVVVNDNCPFAILSPLLSPAPAARRLAFSLLHSRQRLDGGVAPGLRECFAFAQAIAVVELEQLDGAIPNRVCRVEVNAVQHEAAAPAVCARVEQPKQSRRLTDQGADVAPFGVVAAGAGPRESCVLFEFERSMVP